MFCIKCGTKLPDEAVFCYKCGEKLPQIEKPVNNKKEIKEAEKIKKAKIQENNYPKVTSECRISYAPRVATEKEMVAFSKICDVAKHGVQYEENWKALGYSCPKKGFLSFFSKSEENQPMTKNKLLKEFLLDTIVLAGLDVIRVTPNAIIQYLGHNKKDLSDKELHAGLWQRSFHYGQKDIEKYVFSLEKRLKEEGLPANDAKHLQSILGMIRASYTDIFMQIFRDY